VLTRADGSFEWYVLNGHTRRRASRTFPTREAAAAEREKLQAKLDLGKTKVLGRVPDPAAKISHPRPALTHGGASYGRGEGGLTGRGSPQRL